MQIPVRNPKIHTYVSKRGIIHSPPSSSTGAVHTRCAHSRHDGAEGYTLLVVPTDGITNALRHITGSLLHGASSTADCLLCLLKVALATILSRISVGTSRIGKLLSR